MPVTSSLKRPSSYSNCPLKKRPLKYDPLEDSDLDLSCKGASSFPLDPSEPENLSTKPEDLSLKLSTNSTNNILKEKTLLCPPPIALVAGTRDNVDHPNQQFRHHVTSSDSVHQLEPKHLNSTSNTASSYGVHPHHYHVKGPLGPRNLNSAASSTWSKIHPYVPVPAVPLNYTSSNTASPRSIFSPPTPSPRSSAQHQHHQQLSPSSHFTPLNNNFQPGSPPHVSPPLTQEPAYPVLRIEENNRRIVSPSSYNTQEMEIKRENFSHHPSHHHHPHHSHYSNNHPQHHHLSSLKQEIYSPKQQEYNCESSGYYSSSSYQQQLSPSHSPSHSDSGNSRDSTISHHHHNPHYHHHHHDDDEVDMDEEKSKRNSPSNHPSAVAPIVPINVNGSVRYQCPDCSKSYSTYSGLSKHMQFHCASQNKKSFVCKFCEKVYVSLGALKMHIRTHTLPCKCTICGKAFSRPWLLQGHIRTHTGEKPFTCQHCHRAFADRSNLRAHLQTHSEVKKYSCKSCSKTFSRMSLLVKHEEGGCSSCSILTNSE